MGVFSAATMENESVGDIYALLPNDNQPNINNQHILNRLSVSVCVINCD